MIKLNKIKILIAGIISFACLFFFFSKPMQIYAEEECEFTSNWTSTITDYQALTQIDFVDVAPADYEDTNKSINTNIQVFRSSADSTKVAFVYDGVIKAPVNCSLLFAGCSNVKTIGFDNFDTNNVTNMVSMFSMCNNLVSLDLSGFETPKLQGTRNMFGKCSNLAYIDISNLDTRQTVNMMSMFADCSSLSGTFGKNGTAVKIGDNFKTDKVFTMQSMFANCSKIINFDLSEFDLSSINTNPVFTEGEKDMFAKCAFNVFLAPRIIPEGIEINLGGGKYYDSVTNTQYTILDSSLAGRRLIKHNVHTPVDCVCTTCGFIDHNYGEWIEEVPAFCGQIGAKAHYHCDKCNKNFDEEYNEIEDITIIATEHKYSEDWSSDDANHWHECLCGLKKDEAGHTYGDWIITQPATVDKPGLKKRNCTVCEYEQTEVIYHTHDYSEEWKADDANHWHECECGLKKDEASHTFGNWVVTKESTEEQLGERKRVCSVCGYEQIEAFEHTHSYSKEWKADDVNHWYECECGDKKEVFEHSYSAWEITVPATKEELGERKRVCSVCAYEQIEAFEHTHSYSEEWKADDANHWHECECGERIEESAHTYSDWKVVKEATELVEGTKERQCNICKHKETESIAKLAHTHKYSDAWSYNETNHWHECSCGERIEESVHTYGDWKVVKKATTSETGLEEQACECGHKATRVIPKLSSSGNLGLIIGISIAGVFVALLLVYIIMYNFWSKKQKGLKFLVPSFAWIKHKIFKK
ncbi:MAG: BspA family leucine-rich repeat surface protein [Anaeroplasmataceae bacterium]|nr:BspA family leucine-rich repeat surface protein [Anaeroplasmataceae bacterium]MDE6241069.1 BspA family leucine-rich repeat surface protein [Anaeroplasmataceae bacterium]